MSAAEARRRRDDGGYIPMGLYVDAKSVYAAVTATTIKILVDSSLLCHVQYLRELLTNRVLHALVWLDTRDMTADGLTKGAVARDLLHTLMDGTMLVLHEAEVWSAKAPQPTDKQAPSHLCLFALAGSSNAQSCTVDVSDALCDSDDSQCCADSCGMKPAAGEPLLRHVKTHNRPRHRSTRQRTSIAISTALLAGS